VLAEPEGSTVMTTSYDFDETGISVDMANKICDAYASLGAQGISVIYSSGDGGVAGINPDEKCADQFVPTFPSTCP
jgi:tripeptidyl-peptidase-1